MDIYFSISHNSDLGMHVVDLDLIAEFYQDLQFNITSQCANMKISALIIEL